MQDRYCTTCKYSYYGDNICPRCGSTETMNKLIEKYITKIRNVAPEETYILKKLLNQKKK